MASLLRSQHVEKLTYWAPSGTDPYGGLTYASPQVVEGHYEVMLSRISVDGTDVDSNAMIILKETDVAVNGLILHGDHTALAGTQLTAMRRKARRIIRFEKTPGVRKSSELYTRTAWV